MSVNLNDRSRTSIGELRHAPTAKRVRAIIDDHAVVDSLQAVLIWEPQRVTPSYAVPLSDVDGTVADDVSTIDDAAIARFPRRPVLDPSVPFGIHTTPGRRVLISHDTQSSFAGYIADDPQLSELVILDFDGPDRWLEEDSPIVSHPHDPFSRIDVAASARRVTISHRDPDLGDVVLADTTRAQFLFETHLPTRFYIPVDDVLVDLQPSPTVTTCAYKGRASYFSPVVNGEPMADLAWTYLDPLTDGKAVRGLVAFYTEALTIAIDGEVQSAPRF